MPPIREHGMVFDETEDDDDMPPLVDNPNPSRTYTFFADMTPVDYNNSNNAEPNTLVVPSATHDVSLESPTSYASTHLESSLTFDEGMMSMSAQPTRSRGSHGKKRDASYIPRPPNAFILFRSSFIRSEHVPGKVEGNHSNLSKIIGMYWKTLPREEREKWEAKAVLAQAEHRKRYPDWRFRPGANAMAKLKIKDGGTNTNRKRIQSRTKDPPDELDRESRKDNGAAEKGKGKGKAREKEKSSGQEKRCAKIADLLVEGKKGLELEAAVKEWEVDRKSLREGGKAEQAQERGGRNASSVVGVASGSGSGSQSRRPSSKFLNANAGTALDAQDIILDGSEREASHTRNPMRSRSRRSNDEETTRSNHQAPIGRERPRVDTTTSGTTLAKVPLTHMFKRSLSAPASRTRLSYPVGPLDSPTSHLSSRSVTSSVATTPLATTQGTASTHIRRDTVSLPVHSDGAPFEARKYDPSWQRQEDHRRYEGPHRQDHWWETPDTRETSQQSSYTEEGRLGDEDEFTPTSEGLGYEDVSLGQFNQGYLEQHPDNALEGPRDGSHVVNWTVHPGRHGLLTVIDDPYIQDEKISTPSPSSTNPDIPIPIPSSPPLSISPVIHPAHPDSPSKSYYSPISPLPSSSFSTLTGWAGEHNRGATGPHLRNLYRSGPDFRTASGWHQEHGWENHLQPLGLQGGSGHWGQMRMGLDPEPHSRKMVTFDNRHYTQDGYVPHDDDFHFTDSDPPSIHGRSAFDSHEEDMDCPGDVEMDSGPVASTSRN